MCCFGYNPGMNGVIRSDPEILGGRPCFAGTRVPVRNLFDYLAAGESLDDFLTLFPSVTREQAVAVLRLASDQLGAGPISEPVRRPSKTA
jgi:uncharacterized protein (DUF433 family)